MDSSLSTFFLGPMHLNFASPSSSSALSVRLSVCLSLSHLSLVILKTIMELGDGARHCGCALDLNLSFMNANQRPKITLFSPLCSLTINVWGRKRRRLVACFYTVLMGVGVFAFVSQKQQNPLSLSLSFVGGVTSRDLVYKSSPDNYY